MPAKAKNTIPANDLSVKKVLATESDRQIEWKIVGVPGLSLVKMPSGSATYFVRFMAGKGARRKSVRQALGPANDWADGRKAMKLSDAKAQAIALSASGKSAKEDDSSSKIPLQVLFAQFEANDKDRAPRTMADYREALERDVFGELGKVPVGEITAKDIAKLLTAVETRSKNAAHKCRAALGSLYKWGTKRMLVDTNIMLGMGFTHKNEPRERKISDDELVKVWRAIDSVEFGATPSMRLLLKLTILTGQRNSEVAGARQSELHIERSIANPYWQIPKQRMKRKDRDQLVFLSRQAQALFQEAIELAGDGEFVFPATTHGKKAEGVERESLTQTSVSHAMTRLTAIAGVKDLHLHDFRKKISSWLGDHGERSDVLDRILHHHSGHHSGMRSSVTDTHYNFSVMAVPLREAWQKWADHIDRIVSAEQGELANIVALSRSS